MCGVFCNPYWIAGNEKSFIIQHKYPVKNRTGNQKDVVYFEVSISFETMFVLGFFKYVILFDSFTNVTIIPVHTSLHAWTN